jgi:II/X family phage/plasmid replication protein
LDINFTYDLGTDKAVEQWLYSAEYNARCQSGRAVRNSGDNTVYLQKHSRRWAIKFYNKYLEATSGDKKHSLNQHFIDLGLAKFVEGKLRVELRLLSLELKDLGLQHGHQLTPEVLTGLFQTYLEKIEMKPNKLLVDDEIDKLSGKVQNTYRKWRAGKNIKKDLPQNTYYRHRRDLLNVGVDISIPPLEVDKPNNVVPMLRPLEAKPVENPQWAYEQGLIAS